MTAEGQHARTAPGRGSRQGPDATPPTATNRGHAELERGRRQLFDGPVGDAHETLLLAAALLAVDAPDRAEAARLSAADAAWASGDITLCLNTLDDTDPGLRLGTLDDTDPGLRLSTLDDTDPGLRLSTLDDTDPGFRLSTLDDTDPGFRLSSLDDTGPGLRLGSLDGTDRTLRLGSLGGTDPGLRLSTLDDTDPSLRLGSLDDTGPALPLSTLDDTDPALPLSTLGGTDPASAGAHCGRSPSGATGVVLPSAGGGRPGPSGAGRGPGWAPDPFLRDYRDGMRALLARRPELAAGPLRRVLDRARRDDRPERLLRAAAAALLLGDVHAARTAGARALAAARTARCAASEARALEYLAYGELRAGRHAQARAHAEEGVRAALTAGHRNTAASHHAMLALAASIEGDTAAVTGHASAALDTARRHGLAQAATLAEWAIARADLARGRPLDAADRLGPLVTAGSRRGHFAVWMLAVPCYVEAAVLAGEPQDARGVLADLARWAAFGADPHACAQLARCRALLAADDREADDREADGLYLRALALHDASGGEFERARTELLYGRWLRRRRRLREARGRLGAALVGFERCGAGAWADQTRGELRAGGAASAQQPATTLGRLTPQQLRIARHVAEGATNREVARRLAVSTRTVDYHLRNVFAVLGVRSRIELARMVDRELR
ncbi:LuxR C-terminal-related transcriptional regulator [Streptomyces sp. NPDC059696]|uniref:helix-turn-helix transcriptional regulator n=1 Tax=Streptomyces sp. NPDC059696 TaxID=3346911 RepID=UPI0036A4E837